MPRSRNPKGATCECFNTIRRNKLFLQPIAIRVSPSPSWRSPNAWRLHPRPPSMYGKISLPPELTILQSKYPVQTKARHFLLPKHILACLSYHASQMPSGPFGGPSRGSSTCPTVQTKASGSGSFELGQAQAAWVRGAVCTHGSTGSSSSSGTCSC